MTYEPDDLSTYNSRTTYNSRNEGTQRYSHTTLSPMEFLQSWRMDCNNTVATTTVATQTVGYQQGDGGMVLCTKGFFESKVFVEDETGTEKKDAQTLRCADLGMNHTQLELAKQEIDQRN